MPPAIPAELPAKDLLIEAARKAMNAAELPRDRDPERERELQREARHAAALKALAQWEPAVSEMVDLDGAAAFLGLKGPDSIRNRMFRTRADGRPAWPKHDRMFGRSKAWKISTLVVFYAESPGQGAPGVGRRPYKPRTPKA